MHAGTLTEVTIETTIGMIILEVEVGLEKDNTHTTLEGMTESIVGPHWGQDQDQDLVQESVQIVT